MSPDPPAAAPAPPLVARIPPPAVFAAAFAAGWWGQREWAAGLADLEPSRALKIAGFALIALAAVLVAWAALGFARHRTTIVPSGQPSRMILTGPFRFTRNPIYLADAIGYTGLALAFGQWVALALLPLPLLFAGAVTIPMEERRLAAAFGAEYEAYRRRVRRWL